MYSMCNNRSDMTSTIKALISIIPKPLEMTVGNGQFLLSSDTLVTAEIGSAEATATYLRSSLRLAERSHTPNPSTITLRNSTVARGDEGYSLTVESSAITIDASAPAGWFYGAQTLLQLISDTHELGTVIPHVHIVDEPRFRWRGLMLDVSRHLMPVDGILRLLDCMAMHKLNSFHWHLTDDQGWRVESKRYPRLTEIGAFRRGADGELTPGNVDDDLPHVGRYGGFYTHDDIRRVVAHAAGLHIRVVPEIEMPGHAMAALAAYPHLSCTGGTFEPAVRTGVFHDVYCAGNDATFELLEGVLEEILPLFPGEFIHVGGDECPKDRWKTCPKCQSRIREEHLKDEHELQSYVIRRISRFFAERGRKLIGWDEILEGGLAPGATVMSWRGTTGGIAAAKAGRDVVMSPRTPCYLDYRQAATGEPKAIGEVINSLEHVYAFDPIPAELNADQAKHILGLQGNVWTEYMPDMRHVEYMIWPRAAAIAETGWSPAEWKRFEEFASRVKKNEHRLAARGSNYRAISQDQPHSM